MTAITMLIHITGASGSGTSTLAGALSERLNFVHLDADDFYWLPTSPPFSKKREPSVRANLLNTALRTHPNVVLAGSIVGWGHEIEDAFDLIVFLYLDASVRVERLRQREIRRFGLVNPEFLEWAARYDTGSKEGRSLAKHRDWLLARTCPVLELSGDITVEERVTSVLNHLASQSL